MSRDQRLCDTSSPFYYHGISLIPACKSNYMPDKVWGEITYHTETSTVAPLKFRDG